MDPRHPRGRTTLLPRACLLACGLGVFTVAACSSKVTYTCNPACATGLHCVAGGCVPDDPPDLAGADLAVSPCQPGCGPDTFCNAWGHCVACLVDKDCPGGMLCRALSESSSMCVPGCDKDSRCNPDGGEAFMKCCAGACVDTRFDPRNCGACNAGCGGAHSTGGCNDGVCDPGHCTAGWGDCDRDRGNGCEVNLRTDPDNCTACGMACSYPGGVAGCSDKCYLQGCQYAFGDCNNDPSDGCETPIDSDPKNCGGCGLPCPSRPNAHVGCTLAACGITSCNAGWGDCDGDFDNGCEQSLLSDANNCGACGKVCPPGQVCTAGACTCPKCNNAFPNAAANCINNQCVFASCNAGFGDCDGNNANGCEVNLNSDKQNCGKCGAACPPGQTCQSGACQACGNDCWGPAGCLTANGKCIQFTCRAGNSGGNFCNGCKGWKDVTYDMWMNQGWCKDVIATYRISNGTQTKCGGAGACCGSSGACGGGDNAWHIWNPNNGNNYYVGPCLGCGNDTNCTYWNNVDNGGYTRITVCTQ